MALLTIVSMGAWAQIDVQIANDGKFDGGTIKYVDQTKPDEKGFVTVTITVTPNKEKGYTIKKGDISVYSTLSPSGPSAGTRALEIADNLTLYFKGSADADTDDLSAERDYTFNVPSGFGAWVKDAKFQLDGSKSGGEPTRSNDLSGTYYIGSRGYDTSNPASTENFYLCPTEGWAFYVATNMVQSNDNGQPFLTTYMCKNDANYNINKAVWILQKQSTNPDCYYIKQALTGKYMVSNGQLQGAGARRARVHLETVADADALGKLGDMALFEISAHNGHYDIYPHANAGRNGNEKYLVVNANNSNQLYGSDSKTDGPTGFKNCGGIIGVYSSEENENFYLEKATLIKNELDGSGTFTIAATDGATIYYTTDGSTPTLSDYTGTDTTPVSFTVSPTSDVQVIKAISKGSSDASPTDVATYTLPICDQPIITVENNIVTITAVDGATIYFTTDNTKATPSATLYSSPFALGSAAGIRAIATKPGYYWSSEATAFPPLTVSSSSEIVDMNRSYILASDFSQDGHVGTKAAPFKGKIDGNMVTQYGLTYPLVDYADGAIIKNVLVDNVSISANGDGNAGAICGEATGDTRIYNCGVLATDSEVKTNESGYTLITNCSSTISGSNYVGGIVGLLDGNSRVINCFSYANITGGNYVGGIVGFNNVATTSAADNQKTMVMNCMFYGDIDYNATTSRAPIYNGEIITNRSDASGVSNFNYFWSEASYVQKQKITSGKYNCALAAETRYLQRFEFFRHLLNSNRELAAWWATGNRSNKDEIMKWVLEPSQINSSTPYPILKPFDKYPSVVNIDADNAPTATERNKGGKLTSIGTNGELQVTISGATMKTGVSNTFNLVITDKDPDHFNFNYGKVQLPYYNDYCTGNYTGNKVVTGWEVTVTGGSHDFTNSSEDADLESISDDGDLTLTTPYNFADRKSTQKDNYSTNGNRIFNQGAYFDVPEGVTSITIKPHWAKCVFVADEYMDVVYDQNMDNKANVTTIGDGKRYVSSKINIEGTDYPVKTSMSDALTALNPSSTSTVYDNAIVLVGNVHNIGITSTSADKPFTIMSIDLDEDNEPDYSYILRFNGRNSVHPVRIDFLNVIGLGMAQKSTGGTGTYNFGIMNPLDWFEVTNTALFRVTQFEYEHKNRNAKPIILHGGVIEQWVSAQNNGNGNRTNYIHVGGNVWFKEFHLGWHQDNPQSTKHPPVSVTGGDFDNFYLTGFYASTAANYGDNAECYINGGRFGKVSGTGMEGIGKSGGNDNTGNIIWQIDNADIDEFYAGGINAAHIAEGNIYTVISNSRVDQFCGGPKFGDMNSTKKVVTNATNCTFRTFFGAGYGGNSYNRYYPKNKLSIINMESPTWDGWLQNGNTDSPTFDGYKNAYIAARKGVEARIDYQFIPMSDNKTNVARLFIDYVSFSLATTYNVTSKLNNCAITTSPLGRLSISDDYKCLGNFYGGGSLGMVKGPVWSTLINCTVDGNVYGAGYSATLPTVKVMKNSFKKQPEYDPNLGAYLEAELPETDFEYRWEHAATVNKTENAIDKTNHILYTTENLTELGQVTGTATLNIEGSTTVAGSVYGGGEESDVAGNTEVNISDGQINGNVYGGGNLGDVGIIDKTDEKDGQLTYNYAWKQSDGTTANTAENNKITDTNNNTGICKVTITGGTIGTGVEMSDDGTYANGNVFGAGKGLADTWWCEKAIVFATNVTISAGTVRGTVYGGGEVGRVEDDAKVTIGEGSNAPTITGNVFGAGAGIKTHGYSALVRGNSDVTVQGAAQVGGSVYGGGEIASVGRFTVVGGLPKHPDSGGTCKVTIQGSAQIGTSGTGHNVFGACKGVTPAYVGSGDNRSKSMQLLANAPSDPNLWSHYNNDENSLFIWRYYATEADYLAFLKTLALTSHPYVTIGGSAEVYGSVYGGGERGVTLGRVNVDMTGGTVAQDVYGGGALADTNLGNWDESGYVVATALNEGESITNLYARTGSGTSDSPYVYTKITNADTQFSSGTYYRQQATWTDAENKSALYTTTVNLHGGLINGDAYGGGLGQKERGTSGQDGYVPPIEALVYGDVSVNLGKANDDETPATAFRITYATDDTEASVLNSGRVFGCNNLNGSPKGNVTVTVNKTVTGKDASGNDLERTTIERNSETKVITSVATPHVYEVAAVYGGGNLANYVPTTGEVKVIINSCDVSINQVYGGGNAAEVPSTDVLVNGAHEIEQVFGGGNGKDKYYLNGSWHVNQGANVNGNANTLIKGGLVHEAYGGSNELGTIAGNITIDTGSGGLAACPVKVEKLVGAGKNADVNGDLIMIMGCKDATKIPIVYGGADNANVNGNVELTITSGHFGQVFGGNNLGGVIRGHIYLNIEETSDCEPIRIDDLYLGGNQAASSRYGYYVKTTTSEGDNATGVGDPEETAVLNADNKLIFLPRKSAEDTRKPVKTYDMAAKTWTVYQGTDEDPYPLYEEPVLNVISCTSIGRVFGGGLGEGAVMYANPTVNINMILGSKATNNELGEIGIGYTDENSDRVEGGVFGGGNQAAVYGNTTVNIGTETSVNVKSWNYDPTTKEYTAEDRPVLGANIKSNVYGGGNLADIGKTHLGKDSENNTIDIIDKAGNTFVNIGAVRGAEILDDNNNVAGYNYTVVDLKTSAGNDYKGITIAGNVFGGGKGEAISNNAEEYSFRCGKAMVTGGTNVCIGNGTVGILENNKLVTGTGNVYGGGEVGRVEESSRVTIGIGAGTGTPTNAESAPDIKGDVFGAGKGVKTHGYSALVRGHSYVTVEGNAKVGRSVYGGGEIASVGRYNIAKTNDEYPGIEAGMPYSLKNQGSGYCYVTVKGYAEIGPDDMQMKGSEGPDDTGYVFGAGKGILPYEGYADSETPWREHPSNTKEEYDPEHESDYLKYIETLALATQTYVTIDGHAFIKGSVYGGSENGHVQHDTDVKIQGHCQIGNGWDPTKNSNAGGGVNARYNEDLFIDPSTAEATAILTSANALYECAHWDYGVTRQKKDGNGQPMVDDESNPVMETVFLPYDLHNSLGGETTASDGHTFFGNVFGGGSGLYPYYSRKESKYEWLRSAGRVYGNTNVDIAGGHILTSVYGGCELTDVGNGVSVEEGKGKCTVKMSGGTLGVPRTLSQIAAHPVTCYLFGAGKGDQRTRFNQWTNVGSVEVDVSGGIIYGSIFGGGEDGHVLGDVDINITGGVIGTWGTSYVDGNVFGGGRGFSGDALTAGVVCGNVDIDIDDGKMLGSIYGGGRLGSVGTYLVPDTDTGNYGKLIPDGQKVTIDEPNGTVTIEGSNGGNHGHITIDISGGTIGNSYEYIRVPLGTTAAQLETLKSDNYIPNTEFEAIKDANGVDAFRQSHTKGGNVFTGCMGRLYLLDGSPIPRWDDLGKARSTTLTISGGTIKSNVYGGGELGPTVEDTKITITGGTIGTAVTDGDASSPKVLYSFGSVYGGGYGSLIEKLANSDDNPKYYAGRVMGNTEVDMRNGTVLGSVYGGGEMAGVGLSKTFNETPTNNVGNTEVKISGGTIGVEGLGGPTMGNVYGGGSGNRTIVRSGAIYGNTKVEISGSPIIYHNIYGGGAYGSVGDFNYDIRMDETIGTNKVFGINGIQKTDGGEIISGTAEVTIIGGTIGTNGHENGMVFGSSRGDVTNPETRDDYLAWVYNTHVTIGNSEGAGPQINGSIYGSGENGRTFNNAIVDIHGGTIGITDANIDNGAKYSYRGNVYGGGCGTDTYTVDEDNDGTPDVNAEGKTKKYYNPLAGIVYGTTTVNMDGGHVVHNVYGAGAMGSVGKFTFDGTTQKPTAIADGAPENSGKCFVNISGGKIGMTDKQMPDNYGHVFGAGRGDALNPVDYPNVEVSGYVNNTHVTITGSAFVTGSVYGGGESGHVLGDTQVTVSGGQIGCGEGETEPYTAGWDGPSMNECAHWPYNETGAPYDKYANADGYDSQGGSTAATDGHTFYGNVFGGGSGYEPYAAGKWTRSAGLVEGNTKVEITGGHILTNVYGGNEQTDVGNSLKLETGKGKCTITMSGGTVGVPRTHAERLAHPVTGNIFGAGKGDKRLQFNTWTNVGETEVTISGGTVYGSVFGGGEDGHVLGDASTTISGSPIIGTLGTTGYDGNVFGGGRGSVTALTAGVVCGSVSLNIENGSILGSVYGGGRLASLGTYLVPPKADGNSDTDNPKYGKQIPDGKQQVIGGEDETVSSATHGHVMINISGGTIGALGDDGNLKSSLYSIGDVYGGCKGTTDGNLHDVLGVSTNSTINFLGGTVRNAIYGGGEVGNVGEFGQGDLATAAFAKINLLGGSVMNVYGGGLGKLVASQNIDAKAYVKGNVTVNLNGLEKGDYDTMDDAGFPTGFKKTDILDEHEEGSYTFYRVKDSQAGCVVNGTIFGCNNVNGTPTGHSKVHVFKTQARVGQGSDEYDLAAVYGGGNQADYVPTDEVQSTEVIIEGCGVTSIQQVYGGGNAAATPATKVTVKGTKLIDEVFGGGNGVSTETFENPGANVGYHTDKTPYTSGDGKANVELMAGTIHNVYGGSNSNGDIRMGSNITRPTPAWVEEYGSTASCCDKLSTNQIFGGGKNANQKSGTKIVLGCMDADWIEDIYAGAEMADVKGDVSLTLTSGKFGRVFGGNKKSGILDGSIEVNIEENPDCDQPIIIGELYGGGNEAAYSIYGYHGNEPRTKEEYDAMSAAEKEAENLSVPHNSPVVNVRAFTSIGNIFGGGYGATAKMYGSPKVNINEVNRRVSTDTGNDFDEMTLYYVDGVLDKTMTTDSGDMSNVYKVVLPSQEFGKIGAINNVFGGGNAAQVIGNTEVNIGTEAQVYVVKPFNTGADVPTSCFTRTGLGTSSSPYVYTAVLANTKAEDGVNYYELVNVVGADIRGNVYGGGNEAEVTGNTNVTIGKQSVTP